MAQWQRILGSQSSVLNTNGHRTWKYCAKTTVKGFRTGQIPTVRSLRVQYYKANFHVIGTSGRKIMARNGPTPASFCLLSVISNKQYNFYGKSMWKNDMSIQYMAQGFKPTTSWMWVVLHNHQTMTPAQMTKSLVSSANVSTWKHT